MAKSTSGIVASILLLSSKRERERERGRVENKKAKEEVSYLLGIEDQVPHY